MYSIRNSVSLAGNLGRDPEIKTTAKGRKYAKFSLATDKVYKNADGEYITNTTWHNLVAWGNIATSVEKALKKGYMVLVQGSMDNRVYEDKEGNKRYISEVLVSNFDRLTKKGAGSQTDGDKQSGDNLPF